MRPQKSEEEILAERLKNVSYLPALKKADIYFRSGTYFYAYKRANEGIVIGTCSKKKNLAKVVSDVNGKELLQKFTARYRKYDNLQKSLKF